LVPKTAPINSPGHRKILISNLLSPEQWLSFTKHSGFFRAMWILTGWQKHVLPKLLCHNTDKDSKTKVPAIPEMMGSV